jgi:hypothetical protein
MTTRQWLLKIAKAVEDWPTMSKDDVAVAMAVSTPAGAAAYIVNKHIPADARAAVSTALPTLVTGDFAVEARRIREAAESLC